MPPGSLQEIAPVPQLYGKSMTRGEVAAHAGSLSQFAGVRLMTLGDGLERGLRMLEFRTGSGLRFSVLVDRAMDIAEVEHQGRAVGWHSAAGFRHPGLHDVEAEGGFGWARSFSGFLVTCGLDHILGPEVVSTESYNYPGRKTASHGLHGRVSTIPARLTGYGEAWEVDRCILWAEGVISQATVFGENLVLYRRIEADVGGDEIRLIDRVVNEGFLKTPHMMFYHINIGHPVLEEGARYLAPIKDVIWAAHEGRYRVQGVGYKTAPAPSNGFAEQVWQHEMAANAAGEVPVALVNDRIGLGIEVTMLKEQFPCAYQWQYYQSGAYVMGIEPSTHHVLGNQAARDRGEMIWLGPQDSRAYQTRFKVLDGPEQIARSEAAIRAIAAQPEDDFPTPSGQFPHLSGR
ncbi:MAG: aldose 1-epimerase family protein [Cypionkella sp.]|uniref:aldose 1-epimerase family protein n=1 Tax=Cypionkella sp. TaxID=2811411 RepID=UPI002AB89030|nr:aldose 1-epimerase family protein [Cypionkella sp.]MDZ4312183.1 aldose 1-epimerase family protein [Cypionkella sp.]